MADEIKIYVVGFPKSGNSWLTRLIANVVQIPVKEEVMEQTPEMSAEINVRLGLEKDTGNFVAKVHYLPKYFYEEVDPAPKHIIYVFRDFRDVMVSAYFYWNPQAKGEDHALRNWKNGIFGTLQKMVRWRQYGYKRKQMAEFVEKFSREGNGQVKFGNWNQHVEAWREEAGKLTQCRVSFVSYESLLDRPFETMTQLLEEQNLAGISPEHLQQAIEEESFSSLKKKFKNLEKTPFKHDKNSLVKFMRKGKKGDWKNYLGRAMLEDIRKNCGETMDKLGYKI